MCVCIYIYVCVCVCQKMCMCMYICPKSHPHPGKKKTKKKETISWSLGIFGKCFLVAKKTSPQCLPGFPMSPVKPDSCIGCPPSLPLETPRHRVFWIQIAGRMGNLTNLASNLANQATGVTNEPNLVTQMGWVN